MASALATAMVVASLGLFSGAAAAQSPEERRLQQTRERIERVRAEIRGAEQRRDEDAAALAEAERQMEELMEAVAAAELAVQRQRQAVETARSRLDSLERQAELRGQQLAERAAGLYQQGIGAPLAAILSSVTPEQALRRSAYVDQLNRADRRSIEDLAAAGEAVDAQRRRLQAEEESLARVAEQQRELLADVEQLRDERAVVLEHSSVRLQQLQAQEQHLESESRELAALARRASREAAAARSRGPAGQAAPAAQPATGSWVWPTRGTVTSEFGRRWGRLHQGIDIGAPTGTPIVAARAGTVTFVGRMGGYGNITLIDHGGGIVTAYAHQSRMSVAVGQQVGAGQRIGAVGCTGSCTGPHLHFEVRVGGTARNPRGYLP